MPLKSKFLSVKKQIPISNELEFTEHILLHVPLGSTHGVTVHAPKTLHYIWIDLFKDKKGMDWIVQEHIHEKKTPANRA